MNVAARPALLVVGREIRARRAGVGDDHRVLRQQVLQRGDDPLRPDRRLVGARELGERGELRGAGARHRRAAEALRAIGRAVDEARHLVAQRRERQLRVADHRDLGRIVGADHRRIDVDVDHADLARRRMPPAFGRDRARAAADEHHEVGPIDQRAGRPGAAVAADHADGERVVLGDAALTADGGRDRHLQQLGERAQLGLGAGDHRAAAADQERAVRREDRLRGRDDRAGLGRGAARREQPERGIGMEQGLVDRLLLDVEWQADVGSTRPAGGHVAEGGAQRLRDPGAAVDHPVPLGERPEQRLLVELGQDVAAARGDRDVGGHGEDRDRGLVGLDHARQDVGGAAAGRPLADPDPAGDARIGVRHVGGRALVAGQDVA